MKQILYRKSIVISVMGPHAGESENAIFFRKMNDIEQVGRTFWLHKSYKAKPDLIQKFCDQLHNIGEDAFCCFIEASSRGGASPTKTADTASKYSIDNLRWHQLDSNSSKVTGQINHAYALVFSELKLVNVTIDLWDYADYFDQSEPLRIRQGASTLCAVRKDMSDVPHSKKIKSRNRKIIAVGKLCEPGCVYLRK